MVAVEIMPRVLESFHRLAAAAEEPTDEPADHRAPEERDEGPGPERAAGSRRGADHRVPRGQEAERHGHPEGVEREVPRQLEDDRMQDAEPIAARGGAQPRDASADGA